MAGRPYLPAHGPCQVIAQCQLSLCGWPRAGGRGGQATTWPGGVFTPMNTNVRRAGTPVDGKPVLEAPGVTPRQQCHQDVLDPPLSSPFALGSFSETPRTPWAQSFCKGVIHLWRGPASLCGLLLPLDCHCWARRNRPSLGGT